jgi:hypothetical protein
MPRITVARSLHDLGLGAWFGGALMGAVGLNGAAAAAADKNDRARLASVGWAKWAPVNAAAIATHLAGGALIIQSNKGRVASQKGVAGWTIAKLGLTGAAAATTAVSGFYGAKAAKAGPVPAEGATEPGAQTPAEAADALKRLKLLQWAIPALTGAIVVANVVMGEQQRPAEVAKGTGKRLVQAAAAAATKPGLAVDAVGKAVSSVL